MLNIQKGLWIKIEPHANAKFKKRVAFHLSTVYELLEQQEWVYSISPAIEDRLITRIQVLVDDRELVELMQLIENVMIENLSTDKDQIYDNIQVSSTDEFGERLIQKYIQLYIQNHSKGEE